jgi:S-adenosylmethionine/arginine decarboxylase-like enzyme
MFKPGDLVYYDKRASGVNRDFFPFVADEVRAIGVVVSNVKTYDYHGEGVNWIWVLDESGNKIIIPLDYLEPVSN